ncbi:MAG: hypothetical protein WC788_03865 [Candidatus Paceibacterota bacterium]|jgi:uncharacterized repeat protein (TIGR01451 family)
MMYYKRRVEARKTVQAAVLAVSLMSLVSGAHVFGPSKVSHATQAACPLSSQEGRTIVNLNTTDHRIYIRSDKTEPEAKLGPVSASIPAGKYNVTLVSYDDHSNKLTQTQNDERWFLMLKNGSGSLIASTNAISDLADDDDWKTELVNENLEISDDVSALTAMHAAYFSTASPNSIDPICAAFDYIAPIETPKCTLSISKEVDKADAKPGDILTYTLNFSNTGTADCTGGGVRVNDVVDGKLSYVGETHSTNIDGGYGSGGVYDGSTKTLSWNAHTLTPGESGSATWTAEVSTPANCGDYDIANTGNITSWEYSNFQDVVYSNEVHTAVSNACPETRCILNISKEVDKASAGINDVLTYTLNFSNTGTADCTGGGVKVRDAVNERLDFIGETHSDDISAGYNGLDLYDESSRTLIWNAHDLVPGESGSVTWTGKVAAPAICGDFEIPNRADITAWEYSEFNDLIYSNEVTTGVENDCPPETDTLIHLLKRSCPSWSVLSGNGYGEIYDDTNGHFTEFINYSATEPHFPGIYASKPVLPDEIPASCKAEAGWDFKLSTDLDQTQNISTVGPTNADGEIAIHLSELKPEQQSSLTSGGPLWVSEIMKESYDFGALRCYNDARNGDNIEYIQLGSGASRPGEVYCIAYNVKPLPPPPPDVVIALVKSANPTTLPSSGGNVAYSYTATNPGDVPLSDVSLIDDKCAPVNFVGGDADSDLKLDTNETWTYLCEKNIVATTLNTATVSGKYGDDTATASATANVTVEPVTPAPAIGITKSANPSSLPVGGGHVTYAYNITNAGNVPLSNITLMDDKCSSAAYTGGDVNSDLKLDLDESWVYGCSMVLSVTTTNTATATGKYADTTVTKSASATVTVAQITPAPAIHLSKLADKTSLPYTGGQVKYTYSITNPGNVVLTDIILTDDKCSSLNFASGDTNSDSKLDLSESWSYSCEMNITHTTTNTAVATGKSGDQTLSSEAKATVSVANPPGGCTSGCGGGSVLVTEAIKVVKTAVPDKVPSSGGDVVFRYAVSNPGSSQLHDVTMVDDKCSDVKYMSGDTNSDKWLGNSEVWNYECKMAITSETVNTATATGYAGSQKVTDQATAKVTIGLSGVTIKVTKSANPKALPKKGGKAVYSYEISNPGQEALSDVTLTDNKCLDVKLVDGDTNSDGKLDSSEKWHYTCEATLTQTTTNFATARGRVGTSYATDTTSAIVTVGETILPSMMPKTGGGAAAAEQEGNRNILISVAAWIVIAGCVLRSRRV